MKISDMQRTAHRAIWPIALALLCFGVELFFRADLGGSQTAPPPSRNAAPVVGTAAIGFELKTLDGKSIRLESLRGKPLMINFFASWCDPCREEIPLINELASKGLKDGYGVLGIAVEDGRTAVSQFAQEAGLVFPIALDLNSTVKRSYRIFGPPATFFIDAQGVIRDIVLGPMTPERAGEGLKKAGAAR
jgi:cytochrome c biogenesis protein CcmG, thiol:disulfide interchange protein DsbE